MMLDRSYAWIRKGALWIAVILMMAAIIGCSGSDGDSQAVLDNENLDHQDEQDQQDQQDKIDQPDADTHKATSDAELETYLKDQYAKSVHPNNNGYGNGVVDAVPADGGAPARPNENAAESDAAAHSGTNLQENGVDESDKVKTDGTYFYIADRRSFHVVGTTDEMAVLATRFVEGYVDSLYLYDNKLVVLSTAANANGDRWDIAPMPDVAVGMPYWIPPRIAQRVSIYDVSDPRNPTTIKSVEFDGHLISSRRIDGKLHLVQQYMPVLPPMDYWHDGTQEDKENKMRANREAIDKMSLDELIPQYRVVSDPDDTQQEGPTVSSGDFHCPISIDGGGTITTIVTFDLDDAALPFKSMGMVADGHVVYASTKALYIANHQYSITRNDPDSNGFSEKTTIYKFDLTGEAVRFAGGKTLPGWILNQFSLGEYNDVLRVAMTTGHSFGWRQTSKNNVYCLQSTKDDLSVIGALKDLAPGEQIYSARFMGKKGYLVTFKKVDPLFTLDLSDPTNPKEVGELKIPGYSDYIHPYGDNHLITVGKHAVPAKEGDFAWYQGVQLSIFDVSDFANPVLRHKELIGVRGTNTDASYDHKAFSFWAEKDLLALPISLSEYASPPERPNQHGTHTFKGLYVYRVSAENGFEHLGRISTAQDDVPMRRIYYPSWTRGIFAKELIYAITPEAVRSALIDQIGQGVKTLYLPKNGPACDNPAPLEEISSAAGPGYIIRLKPDVELDAELDRLQRKYDIRITDRWENPNRFLAVMPNETMQQIRCEETIEGVSSNKQP